MLNLKLIKGSIIYTVISTFGSFLPLIAAVLYSKLVDDKIMGVADVTGKGEITIICIPLCITILFTLYNYKREVGISKLADIIYVITFFWLAIAVGLYAYAMKGLESPKTGLVMFSIWLLVWTVVSMVASKYIEDDTNLSLRTSRANDQSQLEDKFNKTRN